MIEAEDFIDEAARSGLDFFCGVPCSFLTPLMNAVITSPATRYVGATSEGEAVAIAAGAWLAGRKTAVMFQNSGLGNAVNPLTSLNFPFRIPTLVITTWRGEPGLADEPQHELMGQITAELLATMRIPHDAFPAEKAEIGSKLEAAGRHMGEAEAPYAFILAKGSVASSKLDQPPLPVRPRAVAKGTFTGGEAPRRIEVIERITARLPQGAGVIATTGFCGRELYTAGDHERNLYVVGSMGGASAIGLGAALNSDREIIVLDGDGAALMKLGNLATIGAEAPANLTHIILDNGMHESTGGQMTVSAGVDFAAIASATGYAHAARLDRLEDLDAALDEAFTVKGPRLLHVRVSPSKVEKLGRPKVSPADVARRFRTYLTGPK
ncbi:phosphonopyruvate decarboxylase [Stappia sp. F7233]|uniref:Phosphonopyruvate decarboxylase n=1 Tax=Stappia albiluteola TaxID=2758565 RepID=A0A839AI48_9HYPH|nr:phosphonopyruvate decarboxylase [Stappia albiluteola]MBA5778746.1 phosphonopyruvate decarboxylase [Stappia albiluteola]